MVYRKPAFTPTSLKLCKVKSVLSAFTIVELLVVIVVIGVLAAITVVSYNGITKRATLASLQSDLSSASTKLKSYQTIYGSYPTLDANNCPSAPTVDSNYCLKFSSGNSIAIAPFAGYIPNNSTTPQTFSLTLSSNDIQGIITESSKPSILTPAPLDPVADWIATPQGDHYGNYYDPVSKSWANVTRSTPKTIYDPTTQHIYDVPANYLAINPWSAYQPGGSGSAAVIEEARTNYLVNSYGAANDTYSWTTGWTHWKNVSGVPTKTLTQGVYSGRAQRIQYTSMSDVTKEFQFFSASAVGTFTAGESAVLTAYIKGSTTGVTTRLQISAYDSANTYLGVANSSVITPNDTFTRYSVTFASLPVNTAYCRGILQIAAVDTGDVADVTIDAVQLEKGAFATSYIPTTTATATRSGEKIIVDATQWSPNTTTFIGASYNSRTNGTHLLTWSTSTANDVRIYAPFGYMRTYKSVNGINSVRYFNPSTSEPIGALVYAATFSVGEFSNIFVNGVPTTSSPPVDTLPAFSTAPTQAGIGCLGTLAAYAQGISILQRLNVYNSILSDSSILSVSNTIKAGP